MSVAATEQLGARESVGVGSGRDRAWWWLGLGRRRGRRGNPLGILGFSRTFRQSAFGLDGEVV